MLAKKTPATTKRHSLGPMPNPAASAVQLQAGDLALLKTFFS